jgi:hypothetical protein
VSVVKKLYVNRDTFRPSHSPIFSGPNNIKQHGFFAAVLFNKMDESAEVSDAAQFGIFLLGISMKFNVLVDEELVALMPMKGNATSADL